MRQNFILPIGEAPTDGLVAEYLFSGNANDTSGNGNNGTVTGATLTTDDWFRTNEAYDFDGINDYITASIPNTYSAFTFSCWFKIDVLNIAKNILWYDGFLVDSTSIYIRVTALNVLQFRGVDDASSTLNFNLESSALTTGVWYFITAGFKDGEQYLYINNELVATDTASLVNFTMAGDVNIGRRYISTATDSFFNGKITDVRIYSRVLTDSEITNLYYEKADTGELFQDRGLVAYYPFNGNANDESNNSYNGTVNGATLTSGRYGGVNEAYDFDGINDYIYNNSVPLNSITYISGRFYSTDDTATRDIVRWDSSVSAIPVFLFGVNSTNIRVLHRNDGNTVTQITTPQTLNRWIHFVCGFDGSTLKLYINGELISTVSVSGAISIDRFTIGAANAYSIGYTQFFEGKVDDVRIYNRVLSNKEIEALRKLYPL